MYHNSAENVKAVADEVTASLLNGEAVLYQSRMMNMNIEAEDEDSWQTGQTSKEHRISFTVTFRFISD